MTVKGPAGIGTEDDFTPQRSWQDEFLDRVCKREVN
jgi:hypothetical protein